jgi:hypothetical protein
LLQSAVLRSVAQNQCEDFMREFACPTCSEPRELRTDKNGKPYLICNDCGTQLFVRGKTGIRRLEKLPQASGSTASGAVRRKTLFGS